MSQSFSGWLKAYAPAKVYCHGQGGRVAIGAWHATEGGYGTCERAVAMERAKGRVNQGGAGRASWRTSMFVTRDVFQLLMSSLKLAQAGLQP